MQTESSVRTLGHYEANAVTFREKTADHDVSQNINALLTALDAKPQLSILDFGCGPGRDLRAFQDLGHHPTGLDGCARFVDMARACSGAPVLHQDFLALSLPEAFFDGIFANASLFHVPSHALPRVLGELKRALKIRGILFCSNPRGDSEGWQGDRYGCHFELERWLEFFNAAGFELLHHYYRPEGLPFAEQHWLAMVMRSRL